MVDYVAAMDRAAAPKKPFSEVANSGVSSRPSPAAAARETAANLRLAKKERPLPIPRNESEREMKKLRYQQGRLWALFMDCGNRGGSTRSTSPSPRKH